MRKNEMWMKHDDIFIFYSNEEKVQVFPFSARSSFIFYILYSTVSDTTHCSHTNSFQYYKNVYSCLFLLLWLQTGKWELRSVWFQMCKYWTSFTGKKSQWFLNSLSDFHWDERRRRENFQGNFSLHLSYTLI